MKFVQTISFTTSREAEMRALSDEWTADTEAPGLLGSKLLKDRDRENAYMMIVEFEDYDLAMRNSARPETDAMARRMRELLDGPPVYGNHDVIDEEGPAGPA
jgi:quinol monooxygenase YgiN